MKMVDVSGRVFGRLTVVRRASSDNKKPAVYWECQCQCGNTTIVKASHLKTTKSCGCLRLEKADDLTGQQFHRLTVISRGTNAGQGEKSKARWTCRCECGQEVLVHAGALKSGNTQSCGCHKAELAKINGKSLNYRHGMTGAKAHIVWDSMLQRCCNENHKSYPQYGGRGIKVCDAWYTFENFHTDMGDPLPGLTIDRIDTNGNYEPANCRWATMAEQGRNKRNNFLIEHNGENLTLAEWAKRYSLDRVTLRDRLKRGWTVEQALTTPADLYHQNRPSFCNTRRC